MKVRVERKIGAGTLSIETGELAKQAAGSCLVQYGETVVLCGRGLRAAAEWAVDFFPLTCDYRERVAAAGKFPGGFLKREGRPTTKEILTARLMDRPIRPQFPEGFLDEIQIQSFVLASDQQNDGDVLAMNGASAALTISPLPFQGPLGSVRLGYINGEFIVFPTHDDLEESDLDLIVSGSKDAILMIEGFAREMPEEPHDPGHRQGPRATSARFATCRSSWPQKVGVGQDASMPLPEPNPFIETIRAQVFRGHQAGQADRGQAGPGRGRVGAEGAAKAELIPDRRAADDKALEEKFATAWHALGQPSGIRELILSGTRPDGRDCKTLRPISLRGRRAAARARLGRVPARRDAGPGHRHAGHRQATSSGWTAWSTNTRRSSCCTTTSRRSRWASAAHPRPRPPRNRPRGPGRAERQAGPARPPKISPTRSASSPTSWNPTAPARWPRVCGATLGLMAAGVPISNPVAGISIGLVKEADRWTLLTDIIGDEDHFGDMDFKVAGTQNGITGIQLDLKINGISEEIMAATLTQAREARIEILRKMLTTISRPRAEISAWAPRLLRTHIDPEKIGLLIGPGGKMIRAIQEATGASIEVEDDGTVTVASTRHGRRPKRPCGGSRP